MAACSSLASVGKVMAFGCTVVSTVTRLRSWLRNAPAPCATRRLSASSNSSLSPRLLAPMAQVRALVREGVLENSPVKNWKYGSWTQRSHTLHRMACKTCLSNNSPIMKRVAVSGRPFWV